VQQGLLPGDRGSLGGVGGGHEPVGQVVLSGLDPGGFDLDAGAHGHEGGAVLELPAVSAVLDEVFFFVAVVVGAAAQGEVGDHRPEAVGLVPGAAFDAVGDLVPDLVHRYCVLGQEGVDLGGPAGVVG